MLNLPENPKLSESIHHHFFVFFSIVSTCCFSLGLVSSIYVRGSCVYSRDWQPALFPVMCHCCSCLKLAMLLGRGSGLDHSTPICTTPLFHWRCLLICFLLSFVNFLKQNLHLRVGVHVFMMHMLSTWDRSVTFKWSGKPHPHLLRIQFRMLKGYEIIIWSIILNLNLACWCSWNDECEWKWKGNSTWSQLWALV